MKIFSAGIRQDHYFEDRFGSGGTQFIKGKPSRSFPIAWKNLPQGTQTLALTCIDYDAVPVCGFPWIHWTIANIDPQVEGLPENASLEQRLLEGVTSWGSRLLPEGRRLTQEEATGFGGCSPPDRPHRYTIEVYALDKPLLLERGFYLNELIKAMEGAVLNQAVLYGWYKPKAIK